MLDELTVFIVDDDPGARTALSELMQSVGYRVEEHGSAESFLESNTARRAGCLLLDVRMPGMSGLDLQEELIRRGFGLPTIIITGYGDISLAVRALRHGALDFIEKPFRAQAVLDCAANAFRFERQRVHNDARASEIAARFALLTPREREVMELLVSGQSAKEIAHRLLLSPKTVRIHRSHVLQKMRADSVVTLVRMADSLAADRPNA